MYGKKPESGACRKQARKEKWGADSSPSSRSPHLSPRYKEKAVSMSLHVAGNCMLFLGAGSPALFLCSRDIPADVLRL